MAFMVILIVDDPDDCPGILEAWEAVGVGGVTILDSSGLGRVRRAGMLDNIPLMPSLSDLFASRETQHRTLLSVVDDQETVNKMVAAAKGIIGNLDEHHTGFLIVVPVLEVYGLGRQRQN